MYTYIDIDHGGESRPAQHAMWPLMKQSSSLSLKYDNDISLLCIIIIRALTLNYIISVLQPRTVAVTDIRLGEDMIW